MGTASTEPALESLYAAHHAFVERMVRFWRVKGQDRLDLIQDIWITAFCRYNASIGAGERAWLGAIVWRCVCSYRRRAALFHERYSMDDEQAIASAPADVQAPDSEEALRARLVDDALDMLSDEHKDIIVQHLLFDIDLKDYAREKGMSPRTASRLYAAAEQRFKVVYGHLRQRAGLRSAAVMPLALEMFDIPPLSDAERKEVFLRAHHAFSAYRPPPEAPAEKAPRPLTRRREDRLSPLLSIPIGIAVGVAVILALRACEPTRPAPSLAGIGGEVMASGQVPPRAPAAMQSAAPTLATGEPAAGGSAIEMASPEAPSTRVMPSRAQDAGLATELAILRRADGALRAGRFEEADAALSLHARAFPEGALADERAQMRARLQAARRAAGKAR